MKHLLLNLSLLILLLLSLAGCSSLPEKDMSLNPIRDEALKLMNKASSLEKSHSYEMSYYYYGLALKKYQLTDDQSGALSANIALARQEFMLNKKEQYKESMALIQGKLDFYKNTNLLNEFNFLKIEIAYNEAYYDSALATSKFIKDPNEEQQLKVLCWRCLASMKKGANYQHYFDMLSNLANDDFNKFKKNKYLSSTSLSFAYYVLGLSNYEKKQFKESIKSFNSAIKIDKLDQNFYNLSTDLYYIALNYERLQEYQNASEYFQRALHITQQLNDLNKADEIEYKHLTNLWLYDKNPKTIQKMINLKNRTDNDKLLVIINNWLSDK